MNIKTHFKIILLVTLPIVATAFGCANTRPVNLDTTDCQSAEKCNKKGDLFETNRRDYLSAITANENGCDFGDADSCDQAGYLYGRGLVGEGAGIRAAEMYRRACEIDGVTCVNYAGRLCSGNGVERNPALGLKLAKQSLQHSSLLGYKHHTVGACLEN
ncbi:MAG: sel1 repeat family protein [Deltaproteobacteria bacterium]|nr:sel1 repeat family protein [Deltaproteobacteria bacterium]